jgi:hypothetical protein
VTDNGESSQVAEVVVVTECEYESRWDAAGSVAER